ncbi:hypothetical protein U14_04304 [Candidatus Moduliflexus flocculans]|uniref:Uncharacterized protein n=1 Tax=Candidatus Moduliflexus flocculans TaxID=1499966 RepID=A0A0S6W0A4_9BACT|nr:hypothetical protein U14_04304 [Candidatus Moduliflexus flocculans]
MLTSLNLKKIAHDTVTRYMNDNLRILLDVFNNSETRNKGDPRPSGGNAEQRRETGNNNLCRM